MKVAVSESLKHGVHFQAKALSDLLYAEQQQGKAVAVVY